MRSLLYKHAPIKTERKSNKTPKWWNSGCQQACTVRRQAEPNFKHKRTKEAKYTHTKRKSQMWLLKLLQVLEVDIFKPNLMMQQASQTSVANHNYLLGKEEWHNYPDADSDKDLAETFAQFFETKVHTIKGHKTWLH